MPRPSHWTDVSDESLMQRTILGSVDGFEDLLKRYQDRFFNLAYRMLSQRQEAEDVVQEAFLNIYRSRASFRSGEKFSTWGYRIVSKLCIERLRKRKVQVVSLDAPINDDEGAEPRQVADDSPSPETVVVEREVASEIQRVIDSLPPKYRLIVVLRHVEDLSYEEIVSVTGLPLGTVKNRLFRAREILRKKLEYLKAPAGATPAPAAGVRGEAT